ncbi:imelysin family protein [Nonlabens xiamenensis]|uniref:imelysin family protein n=1 Tax=Nonlabens xiamenensis TaxID=2341043 RepID=UPI000F60CC5B|nr:imelysin family protein [Nonlabens xiamenensis]
MKLRNLLLPLLAIFLILACSESTDDGGSTSDDFDRKALLENAADNIIIPALTQLVEDLEDLQLAQQDFTATPNTTTLASLRTHWLDAYMTWQYIEMFNIGKAEEILYAFQMNIYPTNVTDINNNIASGTYDLSIPNNNDAVGFPALDYLLFGVGQDETAILTAYTTATDAQNRKQYLADLIDRMLELSNVVLDDWNGSYRDQFVNSTGNTATSSVNLLINDFIFYYEKGLRANKIGIPAGVFSTTPLPDRVEAYYSGELSKQLSLAALHASEAFFNGRAFNGMGSGPSYASYATYLRNNNGSEDLTAAINNQLGVARSQMNQLDDNFSEQISTSNQMMTRTYDELQRAVVLLKVDLLQTLNISVDYVDADGD